MHALIKEYVQGCVLCGKSKPANHALRAPLSFREFADTQWDQVSMDFVCGLPPVAGGYDRVLTVVDRGLTKRAHFIKCKSTHTAEHIAQLFLDYVYVHHGVPTSIITDQDPLFMSNFYKGLMSKLKVTMQPGAVYHPQSDGQSEVTNRILKTYLVKFCQDNPSQWHNCLFRAEFEYNYSIKSTGYSAFQLDMGRQPRRIEDVLVNTESDVPAVQQLFDRQEDIVQSAKAALNRAFQMAAKQHDKKTRPTQVKVGDKVYLSTLHLNIPIPGGVKKFKQPYTGPFTVVKVSASGGAATLDLPTSWLAARTWNVEYLKPYTATSSPVFDESADSLASIAISDDSVRLGTADPILSHTTEHNGVSLGTADPILSHNTEHGGKDIGFGDPMRHQATNERPSTDIFSEGMQAATKVVDRIGDYRSKRGNRSAQYLLIFKDQPMSESMWVATDECHVFPGFNAALSQHQGRRVLRSAV
jgi:transposase InsO family protein